jgi:Fe-S-cluster-containing dehydrogenase component
MGKQSNFITRAEFVRLALYSAAGICVGSLIARGNLKDESIEDISQILKNFDWAFIVDTTRCIGCGACVRACGIENKVPDGYFRTWIERYEIDKDENIHVDSPDGGKHSFKQNRVQDKQIVKGFFVPKLCNHCRNSACTQVCPVGATYHSPDGVVLVDRKHCMGCGYCVQACPYGCRYISYDIGTADKCSFCYHRLHRGLPTACVQACPRKARIYGNLKDPHNPVSAVLHERRYSILKPEMATNPKCYYIGLDLEVI